MLRTLTIKNIALIESAEVNFHDNLNIITGETGAGKSMILDSLDFVLGSKIPKDFLRQGAKDGFVSVVIELSPKNIPYIRETGVNIDDDSTLIIEREITDSGRQLSRINGKTVTVGTLKEIRSYLFDFHSQHDSQYLLKQSKHIEILDMFCGADFFSKKAELAAIIREIKLIETEKTSVETDDNLLEFYEYQIREIEAAELSPTEEDELYDRRRIINSREQIIKHKDSALHSLTGTGGVLEKMALASKSIVNLASFDKHAVPLSETIEGLCIGLTELSRDLGAYQTDGTDLDALGLIEKRLDILYNLKRKYGKNIPEILAFLDKTREKYEQLQNSAVTIENLDKKLRQLNTKAREICSVLSSKRHEAARGISEKIENALRDLEMKDAKFMIDIKMTDITTAGFDRAEFLLSPNIGEPLKPLATIASGGEMSRIMLALKSALVIGEPYETIVLDEIDAGVSGRTAQKVALKLCALSRDKQVICITHLPQIAAYADTHILVVKRQADERTVTEVDTLTDAQTVNELARLIGGAVITKKTLVAAAELREMSMNN